MMPIALRLTIGAPERLGEVIVQMVSVLPHSRTNVTKEETLDADAVRLIHAITSELRDQADPSYRELVRTRYNMNVDDFWGVRTPVIHRIAGKHHKQVKSLTLDQRLAICDELLATEVYEHKIVAFRWAHLGRRDFEIKHLRGSPGGWMCMWMTGSTAMTSVFTYSGSFSSFTRLKLR